MKLSNYLLSALMGQDDPMKAYAIGAQAAAVPTEVAAKNALLQKTQMEVEGQKAAQDMVKNYDWSKLGEYGQLMKMSAMSGNMGKSLDLLKANIEKQDDITKAKLNNYSDYVLSTMRTLESPAQLPAAAASIEKTFPGMGQNWPSEEKFKNPDGSYNMEGFKTWKMMGLGPSAFINYLTAQTTSEAKRDVAGVSAGARVKSAETTATSRVKVAEIRTEGQKELEKIKGENKGKGEGQGKGKGEGQKNWGNTKRNEGGGEKIEAPPGYVSTGRMHNGKPLYENPNASKEQKYWTP